MCSIVLVLERADATGETFMSPIAISSIEELQKIGNDPEFPLDGHYLLTQDIDASETSKWDDGKGFSPIAGSGDDAFTGLLDGKGYKVTGLTINRPEEPIVGLFGRVGLAGAAQELTLHECNMVGGGCVAGVAAINAGLLSKCCVKGTIEAYLKESTLGGLVGANTGIIAESSSSTRVCGHGAKSSVGGLAGTNEGLIRVSFATGQTSGMGEDGNTGGLVGTNSGTILGLYSTGVSEGESHVGGGVGRNSGTVSRCHTTGEVWVGRDDAAAGGLVAVNDKGMITASYSTSGIECSFRAGGLVGLNTGTISGCHASGKVKGDYYLGGLVGDNKATVIACSASGEIIGGGSVGGLIGTSEGVVRDSFATGNVSGDEGSIGGLLGYNSGRVSICFAVGRITDGDSESGGLVGANSGVVWSSYWNRETTGMTESDGSDPSCGKSTEEMKQAETYEGWIFEKKWSEWKIDPDENSGYPSLKNRP
jgi:hypothetical protein